MTPHNPVAAPQNRPLMQTGAQKNHLYLLPRLFDPGDDEPAAIVAAIARGSRHAEQLLARRFERVLRPRLAAISSNPAQRDDLFQETFMNVLQRLRAGRLNDAAKLDGYIYRTALFLMYAEIRIRKRIDEYVDVYDQLDRSIESRGVDEQIDASILATVLREAIEALRMERDRELVSGACLYERSKVEMSALLQLSPEHFDRVLYRARRRLRAVLEENHSNVISEWIKSDTLRKRRRSSA